MWAAATTAIALTACGGGSTKSTASASASESNASASASSSAPPSDADAATIAIAQKAVLTAADLGANYVVDQAASVNEITADDCGAKTGSPLLAIGKGASQLGESVHFKDAQWFISSVATVFADEVASKQWIDIRKSAAWVECRRLQFETEQKKGNASFSVETRSTSVDTLGSSGFEAYTLFQARFDDGTGVRDANGQFIRYAFRKGRVVVTIGLNIVNGANDPANLSQTVSDDLNRAVDAALARVDG